MKISLVYFCILYLSVVSVFAQQPDKDFVQAKEYMKLKDSQKAYPLLLQAWERDTTNVDILKCLAEVSESLRAYEISINYFTKAISYANDSARAYLYANRARIYIHLEQYSNAIIDCDSSLLINPKQKGGFLNRGVVYDKTGMSDKAIEQFDIVISLDSASYAAYAQKGLVYTHKQEYDKAIVYFDKATKINPDFDMSYQWKGITLFKMEEYDKAIVCFTKAYECDKYLTEALYWKGRCYMMMNNQVMACENFKQGYKETVEPEAKAFLKELLEEMQCE